MHYTQFVIFRVRIAATMLASAAMPTTDNKIEEMKLFWASIILEMTNS